jgi:membrane protease YdiL (CAAX protease family)
MNLLDLILHPQTRKLRSGWRALFFAAVLTLPLFLPFGLRQQGESTENGVLEVNFAMAFVYLVMSAWVVVVSWLCLRFLEQLRLRALGLAFHQGWFRDVCKGLAMAAAMMAATAALEMISGGLRLAVNPTLRAAPGKTIAGLLAALGLFALAAAFEELIYRGYAFQTLLRGVPAAVPILLLSVLFAWGHWDNPNRSFFSTINTALAGVWLSLAYLRTRSLWFPIGLHFGWNWVMGAVFGVPVSGLLIPREPLLRASIGGPLWWTGGDYGSEGGAAATLVYIVACFLLWRAKWLRVSPEMETAFAENAQVEPEAIRLGL